MFSSGSIYPGRVNDAGRPRELDPPLCAPVLTRRQPVSPDSGLSVAYGSDTLAGQRALPWCHFSRRLLQRGFLLHVEKKTVQSTRFVSWSVLLLFWTNSTGVVSDEILVLCEIL